MRIFWSSFETPVAPMFAAVDAQGAIVRLDFLAGRTAADLLREFEDRGSEASDVIEDPAATAHVERQLHEYFLGSRPEFELALSPAGTAFQKLVWAELLRIGHGETISYTELARRIGRPFAARAVGRANATNRIAVVIPCHRVIAADGSLSGYASGTQIKRALLELEEGL